MPISFAGIDLILDWPDPDTHCADGSIETFLDRFSPLEDLRLFGSAPVAVADGRWAPRNPSKQAVGLATHNWSMPPRLRLNTLFWPATGASRWAYFVGLADEARLDRIIAALATSDDDQFNRHGKLIISEGNSHRKRKLETNMYLLPPRRIAVDATAGSTKLWLLPLVDERYLWQFWSVENYTANNIGSADFTWAKLLGDTAYGFNIPYRRAGLDLDAISADYFKPDALSFDVRDANIAVALDCALESVGMRLVRDFAGICYGMAPARSATRLQDSLGPSGLSENGYEIIAGGKNNKRNSLLLPDRVFVMFPTWLGSGRYHQVEILASAFTSELTAYARKVIYTRAEAEFDSSGTLNNSADLTTLATRIARDFYAWREESYDITFAGVKEWKPNGFDDWLIYSHASHCPTGEPTLRVMSHPYNFGVENQFQSFRFLFPTNGILGKTDASHAKSAFGMVSIWAGAIGSETDTTVNVRAYNKFATIGSGKWVWLANDGDGWYITAAEC